LDVLDKSIALGYITGKIALKNLEVTLHEMSIIDHPNAGRIQHRVEKLINAFNTLYRTMEKNMDKEGLKEVSAKIELLVDECWD